MGKCKYSGICQCCSAWCFNDTPITGPIEDCVPNLINEIKEIKNERDSLELRLRHLLASKTISMYDELDPKTRLYKRDITELDQWAKNNFKCAVFRPDDTICGRRIGDVIAHIEYCEENGIDITSFADGVRYGMKKMMKVVRKFFEERR